MNQKMLGATNGYDIYHSALIELGWLWLHTEDNYNAILENCAVFLLTGKAP